MKIIKKLLRSKSLQGIIVLAIILSIISVIALCRKPAQQQILLKQDFTAKEIEASFKKLNESYRKSAPQQIFLKHDLTTEEIDASFRKINRTLKQLKNFKCRNSTSLYHK